MIVRTAGATSPTAASGGGREGAVCAAVGKMRVCFVRRRSCRAPQTDGGPYIEVACRDRRPRRSAVAVSIGRHGRFMNRPYERNRLLVGTVVLDGPLFVYEKRTAGTAVPTLVYSLSASIAFISRQ